eukprot:14647901-Heterocapsa_arctica.AAC.2
MGDYSHIMAPLCAWVSAGHQGSRTGLNPTMNTHIVLAAGSRPQKSLAATPPGRSHVRDTRQSCGERSDPKETSQARGQTPRRPHRRWGRGQHRARVIHEHGSPMNARHALCPERKHT